MAKTAADLAKSRRQRQRITDMFGGEVPTTIWVVDHGIGSGVDQFGKTQADIGKRKFHKRVLTGELDPRMKGPFVVGLRGRGRWGGLSIFPYNIARRVVLYYSEPGDVVLDPCAGHNSRMQAVWEQDRSYIGYDVCHEFMEFNKKMAEKIQKRGSGPKQLVKRSRGTITLREQSSEQMVEEGDSVDLVFTSPPYWDLEYYGDHPDQLGLGRTYDEFLDGLGRIAAESFRALKPDGFCVINVNDFRKDGQFYMYHADAARCFLSVGFEAFDVIIMAWPSLPLLSIFATKSYKNRKTGKQHEYLLVFKKPERR